MPGQRPHVQAEVPRGSGRYGRCRRWRTRPVRVVYVDGIWVASDCVVLIACSDEFVLSWHLARAETDRGVEALLSRVAAPEVVVTDGGSGFAAAVAAEWPSTKVQRCVFHAFCQVKRQTTTRPKLQAGIELYGAGQGAAACGDPRSRPTGGSSASGSGASFWADFLEQRSVVDGRIGLHARAGCGAARSGLVRLANAGTLFTYLDPALRGRRAASGHEQQDRGRA